MDQPAKSTFDKIVGAVCQDFIDIVKLSAIRQPNMIFKVIKPLPRPRFKWFTEVYDVICKFLLDGVHKLKLGNITMVECIQLILRVTPLNAGELKV